MCRWGSVILRQAAITESGPPHNSNAGPTLSSPRQFRQHVGPTLLLERQRRADIAVRATSCGPPGRRRQLDTAGPDRPGLLGDGLLEGNRAAVAIGVDRTETELPVALGDVERDAGDVASLGDVGPCR